MRPSVLTTIEPDDIKCIVEVYKIEKSFRRTAKFLCISDYQVKSVLIHEGIVEKDPVIKHKKSNFIKPPSVDGHGRKLTLCYCPSCRKEHNKKINYIGVQKVPWYQCDSCKNKHMDWSQHSVGGPVR